MCIASRFLRLALVVAVSSFAGDRASAAAGGSPDAGALHPLGFVSDPEIDKIESLTKEGKRDAAHDLASAILARPPSAFHSAASERVLKATALFLRAQVAKSEAEAMRDLLSAAAQGHPEAPYHIGAHLLIEARSSGPERSARLAPQIEASFLAGAGLGDPQCMELLETIYKQSGKNDDANYWGLIRRMTEADENGRRAFDKVSREIFTSSDRSLLDRVLRQKSPSGGPTASAVRGVPGRSIPTSAFVDTWMRKQLAFVWRASFNPDAPDATVTQAFEDNRRVVRVDPFGQVLLLLGSRSGSGDGIVPLSHDELAAAILPGDNIVVLSGGRSHYATVWAIDRGAGTVSVLDPFPEYWQPTHNAAITKMDRIDYAPGRQLIRLSWPEVRDMLMAAIVVRDSAPAPSAKGR